MSENATAISVRFPHATRQRQLTVTLGCILIGVLIALALIWLLVYQSVIATTEGPPEVGTYSTQFMVSWYGTAGEILRRPSGIAVDEERRQVFVTDSYRAMVYILDLECERTGSFDGGTEPDYRLELPTSIAVASTGQVYVVDAALQKLVIFDEYHQPVRSVRFAEEPPKAVAVIENRDGTEELWVLSYSGVTRGTLDGDFEWGYYARGEGPGQFNNPSDLAGISDETSSTLLVCDTFNYRVQAFEVIDEKLELSWIYGSSDETTTTQSGEYAERGTTRLLDLPVAVTTDDDEQVFVLDGMGASIITLDRRTGEMITSYGIAGSQEGQLLYPSAIAYSTDQIWVVDQGNSRVSVFSQKEVPPAPRLTRAHFPLELLWMLIGLLTLIEIGCLVWLASIRSTRLVMAMDALERIDDREMGSVIAEVVEHLNVAPGIETFAQQASPDSRIATAPLSKRKITQL
ncbi:MAG: hypothetical protein FWE87_00865, partial [Coriobacteriia bacterium]|nr:hypothetical protein [Coriobacteriia bacterium]